MYSDADLEKLDTVNNLVKEIWKQFGEKYTKVEIAAAVTIIEAVMMAWGNCENFIIDSIRETQNELVKQYRAEPGKISQTLGMVEK